MLGFLLFLFVVFLSVLMVCSLAWVVINRIKIVDWLEELYLDLKNRVR